MLAPPFIRNALLIPEKNNMRQVSATVAGGPSRGIVRESVSYAWLAL